MPLFKLRSQCTSGRCERLVALKAIEKYDFGRSQTLIPVSAQATFFYVGFAIQLITGMAEIIFHS